MNDPVGGHEHYRTLLETVGDPAYALDADGYVTGANRAMADLLGRAGVEDVIGVHVTSFRPDADDERRRDRLQALLEDAGRRRSRFEGEVVTADAGRDRVETTVTPLTDDGRLVGSVGVVRRVPEERSRERALTDDIERLQAFTTDLQSVETAEELFELTVEAAEDAIGLEWTVLAIAEEGWFELKAVSADAPLSVGERHLRVDEGLAGETLRGGQSHVVEDIRTHEGGAPADPSFVAALSVPVGDHGVLQANHSDPGHFDEDDCRLAEVLAAHAAEALGRIERERELRELTATVERLHHATTTFQSCTSAEEIYERVIDAAENVLAFDWSVVAIADDGWLELKAVSPEAPLAVGGRHLQVDEGVAGSVYQSGESEVIATPEDHPASDPVDDSFTANITVALGDRGVFQANAEDAGYFDEDDLELAEILAAHASEALGRVERERELRERERELRRQNERLERFASVVSHDLRNPLNVAAGYLETVDHPMVAEAERSLDRMETIVEEVLELARQGETIDDPRPVSFGDALEAARDGLDTTGVTVSGPTERRTVLADEDRLVRLLENLLKNAVVHGGDAVTVGFTDDGFFVADDGPGIPEDDREAVLEMGYTTAEEGSGFGLSIVAEIADAHGWTVDVTDADSGGARFEFAGVEDVTDD